jgi:hypothetical protein
MNSRFADFLPRLYLPLLAVLCFVFTWQPLLGVDDFWAHAAIGRWIGEHSEVPHQTLFVWGPGTPIPWVYHSWLSQFVFFKTLHWGGPHFGPVYALLLTYLVATAVMVWLWLLWAKRSRVTALMPFLFVIALWCSSPRLHPRPELFSGLFLCALMTFLLVWTERRSENKLPSHLMLRVLGLAALFALWANFHGGVVSGLVFIALTIIGEAVQDSLDKRALRPTLLLCGILLVCIAAINFNPYGFAYWSALKPVGGPMFSQINEWKKLWEVPLMAPEAFIVTGLLAILALNAWLQNPQRRVAHLLWLLFATFSFVMARRQIWTFAQICIIVMAANALMLDTQRFWRIWNPKGEAEIPMRLRVAARLCAIACLLLFVPGAMPPNFLPLRSTSEQLPVSAAEFVKQNLQTSRLFCDYATSSYLNWHLAGKPPVYIDLINAYPDRLLGDYWDIIYLKPEGLKKLDEAQVTHILIKGQTSDDKIANFAKYMQSAPQWKVIYRAKDATIWARR